MLLLLSREEYGVRLNSNIDALEFAQELTLQCRFSAMCAPLVYSRKTQTGFGPPTWVDASDHWVQTNGCCVKGMHETKADILVSNFLFLDVSCAFVNQISRGRALTFLITYRGDVLNTTV